MPHIDPLRPEDVPELAPVLDRAAAVMGFVPNSLLTMAHLPDLPSAFSALAAAVLGTRAVRGTAGAAPPSDETGSGLPPDLIQLVAHAASMTAGCRYCQAHTSHSAHRLGVPEQKLAELARYRQSEQFNEAERAALDLAFAAAAVPNETQPEHFERLRRHFDERQIVQLVAVIALFGFLNRWNDTLATALEPPPSAFAEKALGHRGWEAGKHRR